MAGHSKLVEPEIIIKKVPGHAAHHGGAWKVAYADFVTAMMALFIVLWLLSASEQVRKAIGGYFNDPTGKGKLTGTTRAGAGEAIKVDDLSSLKKKIEEAMAKELQDFDKLKEHVRMTITEEGLRIEFLETAAGVFFESGNASPSKAGEALFSQLAEQIGSLPNLLVIEGHTDAKPFPSGKGYSNWELSADRANAVRRLMRQHGLRDDQVTQIRGYADQQLRKPDAPEDPSNRRISILVRRTAAPPEPAEPSTASAAPVAREPSAH
jgi:chemotaxis protein MotB